MYIREHQYWNANVQELAQLFTSVVPRQVRKMTNLYNTYNIGRGKRNRKEKSKEYNSNIQ